MKGKLPFCDEYFITTFFQPKIRKPNTRLFPPILRPEILAAKAEEGEHLLVYQTAEGNEELVKAGVMLAGEGLQASSKGARVRFEGKKRTVLDGPFSETKELIAGYWMWQVRSREEAIEWLKRAPFQEGEVELRQVFETEDFAPVDPTGELRAQESELRKLAEARARA